MKARLAINSRESDPFGLPQVPGPRVLFHGDPLPLPSTEKPFAEIVDALHLTAIDSARKEVLFGHRSFRLGQDFRLVQGSTELRVQVVKITAHAVTLRNSDTGESATLEFKTQPLEQMDHQAPPLPEGVEPANPAEPAPLHLPA